MEVIKNVIIWILIVLNLIFILRQYKKVEKELDLAEEELNRNLGIPSQTEIQEFLISKGYDIEADGKVGRKTRLAWDDYYCKQIIKEIGKGQ